MPPWGPCAVQSAGAAPISPSLPLQLLLISSSSSLPTPSVCPGWPGDPREAPAPFLSPRSSQLLADPILFPFPCPVAPPRSPRDGRGAFSSVPRGPCPVPSPGSSPTGAVAFQPRGEEGKGCGMLCWGSGIATPAGDVQQPAELTTASAACCYFCSSLSVALLVQFELQTEFKLLRAGLNPGLLGLGLLLLAQQHEQGVAEGQQR